MANVSHDLGTEPDWSIRDRLLLVSAVQRDGDDDWPLVSSTLVRLSDTFDNNITAAHTFSHDNCARQYDKLRATSGDTDKKAGKISVDSLVQKFRQQRIDQLRQLVAETRASYRAIADEVRQLRLGLIDHKLDEMLEEVTTAEASENDSERPTKRARLELPVSVRSISTSAASNIEGGSAKTSKAPTTMGNQENDASSKTESVSDDHLKSVSMSNSPSIKMERDDTLAIGSDKTKLFDSSEISTPSDNTVSVIPTKTQSVSVPELASEPEIGSSTVTGASRDVKDSSMHAPVSDVQVSSGKSIAICVTTTSTAALKSSITSNFSDSVIFPLSLDDTVKSSFATFRSVGNVFNSDESVNQKDLTQAGSVAVLQLSQPPVELTAEQTQLKPYENDATLDSSTRIAEVDESVCKSAQLQESEVFANLSSDPLPVDSTEVSEDLPQSDVGQRRQSRSSVMAAAARNCYSDGSRRRHDKYCAHIPSAAESFTEPSDSLQNEGTYSMPAKSIKREIGSFESMNDEDATLLTSGDLKSSSSERNGLALDSPGPPGSPLSVVSGEDCSSEASSIDSRRMQQWRKSASTVWQELAAHRHAPIFMHPIPTITSDQLSPVSTTDYARVIRQPMNLETIKRRYIDTTPSLHPATAAAQFRRDIMLMFSNAIMFNSHRKQTYHYAVEMRDECSSILSQLLMTSEDAANDSVCGETFPVSESVPLKREDSKRSRSSVDGHNQQPRNQHQRSRKRR